MRPEIAKEREEYIKWQLQQPRDVLVFIDESACKTNYIPLRGWSERGDKCSDHAPTSWKTYSMLSSINFFGKTESMIIDGGVTREIFKEYMENQLLPTLGPGNIVIRDNCSIHKNSFNLGQFIKKGVEIKYLPRYSPDLNPIENMWSKVKNKIRLC